MADPIKILSMHLTDNMRVVQTSIALQVGGKMGAEAKAFYALRDAFNVRGYASQIEAEAAIRQKLTEPPTMTAAVTPSREALLAGDELSEAHALLKQCGYNFNETHPECYRDFSYVRFFTLLRLAAKPADEPDPDAMNERRAADDAANVRAATLAEIAKPTDEGLLRRCADIALAIDSGRGNEKEIAKAILALSTTGEPKR